MNENTKKSSIETRTEQSKTPRGTDATPINIDFKFPKIEKEILTLLDDNKTLERLEADRKKVDPDFYKGLGTFFVKKFLKYFALTKADYDDLVLHSHIIYTLI